MIKSACDLYAKMHFVDFDTEGISISRTHLFQHTTTVNQISIDDHGDFIASCSDDGRVGN